MKTTIFKNLLKAIGIMGYFMVLNLAYTRMNTERLMNDIEVFAGIFLVLGLIFLERAYKKDNGTKALSGIELLFLSMHSLSINHVITFYQYDFRVYLLTSSYVFAIYYVLKSIVIYTREKRQYLKKLSDISEIVKEEPIKKEAKKRRKTKTTNNKVEEKVENISNVKQEKIKSETKVKSKEKNKEKTKEEKEDKKVEVEKEVKQEVKRKTVPKKQKKKEENKEGKTKEVKTKSKKSKKENKEESKEKEIKEVKKENTKENKKKSKKKEVVDND